LLDSSHLWFSGCHLVNGRKYLFRGGFRRPSDVNGVYGAAGAGVAVGRGAGGIVLTNQNGAVLSLSGRQAGLIIAADLNGLVISLR
jgi:hypothetical protein